MTPEQARAFWDGRYGDESYLFGEQPNAFLARQADRLRPGLTALAIADGEGRNGVWLARQGLKVTSTDISPRAVAKARALAARHGVEVDARLADLEGVDTYPRLLAALMANGWTEADIRKLAGENVLRVMRAVEAVAASKRAERPRLDVIAAPGN